MSSTIRLFCCITAQLDPLVRQLEFQSAPTPGRIFFFFNYYMSKHKHTLSVSGTYTHMHVCIDMCIYACVSVCVSALLFNLFFVCELGCFEEYIDTVIFESMDLFPVSVSFQPLP